MRSTILQIPRLSCHLRHEKATVQSLPLKPTVGPYLLGVDYQLTPVASLRPAASAHLYPKVDLELVVEAVLFVVGVVEDNPLGQVVSPSGSPTGRSYEEVGVDTQADSYPTVVDNFAAALFGED